MDLEKSGDRKASCRAAMKPMGLTFKNEGFDKYGKPRQGELMLIHICTDETCQKISINRIAADDQPEAILKVFQESQKLDKGLKRKIAKADIKLLAKSDEKEIRNQLFGKSNP